MSLSRNSLASLLADVEPLIIHHWDADGIASAVTVAQFVGPGAIFVVPPFTYRPPRDFVEQVSKLAANKDVVLVLDYNAPPEVYASLVTAIGGRPVVAVDHHTTTYPRVPNFYYYNPAAEGDPNGLWPSAAHVIADALGFYDPMLVAMSIYGDLWDDSVNNRVYRAYMEEVGLDVKEDSELIRNCAMQIWAAEAAKLKDVIDGLAYSLAYGGADPCEAILSDPRMTNAREAVEEELSRARSAASRKEELNGRVLAFGVTTKYKITGMLARQLARENAGKIVVVYSVEEGATGRIYVRGLAQAKPLIEELRSKGLNVGGKSQRSNNVVSLEVQPGDLEQAVDLVIKSIGKLADVLVSNG